MTETIDTSDSHLDRFDDFEEGEVEDGELIDEDDADNIYNSDSEKLSLRAKRFGISEVNTPAVKNSELERLHKSMGVDKDTRTEVLHLLGTDNMKTLDVFSYFSGYSPASIEWISDKSCNVVWLDEEACANAFKKRSVKIKGLSVETDDLDESEDSINIEDIRCSLPPGIWRKGHSHSLAPHIFIRYANRFDKKLMQPQSHNFGNGVYNKSIFLDQGDEVGKKLRLETGNPWADIARQWRNFENKTNTVPQGVKDAREVLNYRDIRKPKYSMNRLRSPAVKSEEVEVKNALLKSRKMQADIEERKIQERNKHLSNYTVGGKRKQDLREHLGRKRKRTDFDDFDEIVDEKWKPEPAKEKEDISLRIEIDNSRESDEEDWNDSRSNGTSSGGEREACSVDLRNKLKRKKPNHRKKDNCVKSVLRTKYINHSSSRPAPTYSPLRIEIGNDVYQGSSGDED